MLSHVALLFLIPPCIAEMRFINLTSPIAAIDLASPTQSEHHVSTVSSSVITPAARLATSNPPHFSTLLFAGETVFNFDPPNPYSGLTDLAAQCSPDFDSSYSRWLAKATLSTTAETATWSSIITSTAAQTFTVLEDSFTFSAAEPCCLSCSLYGGHVTVYHWPSPAPTPAISTLVDVKNNHTFVSPSVYVVFSSLYAANLCGGVGRDIPLTTLAFNPGEVSTALLSNYFANVAAVPMLTAGAPIVQEVSEASQTLGPFYKATFDHEVTDCANRTYTSLSREYTYSSCSPWVSVPSQLFTLNPEWKTCVQGIQAFLDPPSALVPTGSLTPYTEPKATPAPVPTPHQLIEALTPTPTSTVTPTPSPEPAPGPPPSPAPSPEPAPGPPPSASSTNASPVLHESPFPALHESLSPATSSRPAASQSPNPPDPAPIPHGASSAPLVSVLPVSPVQSLELVQSSANPGPSQPPSAQGLNILSSAPSPESQAHPALDSSFPNSVSNMGMSSILPQSPVAAQTHLTPTSSNTVLGFIEPQPSLADAGSATPAPSTIVISGTSYLVPLSKEVVVTSGSVVQTTWLAVPSPVSVHPASATYIFGSQTLAAGGAFITVSSSILIGLLSGGSSVLVQESTTAEILPINAIFSSTVLALATATNSDAGVADVIASLGGFSIPTGTSYVASNVSVLPTGGGNFTGPLFLGGSVQSTAELWSTGIGVVATLVVLCIL